MQRQPDLTFLCRLIEPCSIRDLSPDDRWAVRQLVKDGLVRIKGMPWTKGRRAELTTKGTINMLNRLHAKDHRDRSVRHQPSKTMNE